ncbi:hypothetical protein BO83DRAFT_376365 [Aspergillus eucalypticola CBS 122712]|uniref:Secreted protein n=1 Tax=Aspergillus eucalypticola (strain CBS 122712 / IBT 29274) TaxID=1448314 RepID=A0A317VYG7_ASPEC|nr:uncharacterized protein BO83DRAFT_376365 [Aspergillus eucalypticola CBS 122712]PWY78825.1 hypothetical protein BO83DRAFT_376365 [Aspergillus eucalypticola CBS 122712]
MPADRCRSLVLAFFFFGPFLLPNLLRCDIRGEGGEEEDAERELGFQTPAERGSRMFIAFRLTCTCRAVILSFYHYSDIC